LCNQHALLLDGGKQRLAASEDDATSRGSGAGVIVPSRKPLPSSSSSPTFQITEDSTSTGSAAPNSQPARTMSPVVRHASPMARRENRYCSPTMIPFIQEDFFPINFEFHIVYRRAAVMVDMPTNFNFEDLAAEFAKEEANTTPASVPRVNGTPSPKGSQLPSSTSDPIPRSLSSSSSPSNSSILTQGRTSPKPLPAIPQQAKVKPDLQAKMQSATNSVAEGIALVKQ
jgi:hypothetical protein